MSPLRDLLQKELDRRNWSQRDLAAATDAAERKALEQWGYTKPGKKREDAYGINQSTVATIMGGRTPDLGTAYALALGLALDSSDTISGWFSRIVAAMGYPMGESKGLDERRARALAILSALPDLNLLERIAGLPAHEQRAVAAFVETLTRQPTGLAKSGQ